MDSIYNDRLKKYKDKVCSLESKINRFVMLSQTNTLEETDDINSIVFKKYIELSDVRRVADYINSLGLKIPTNTYVGERKYLTNDITQILKSKAEVNPELRECVSLMKELDKTFSKINIKI
ncbi:hypothetical protein DIC82_14985 [Clostridium beijerinckii]|nr:hypothetical protein DIC82_14985 [Clostridium beijerinckii]